MMLDATRHYDQPLTAERLFSWHASLFPTGRSGMVRIGVGTWRNAAQARWRWFPGRWQGARCISKHRRQRASTGDEDISALVQPRTAAWIGLESRAGSSVVRDHPPFRRCNGRIARRDRRYGTGALRNTSQRFYSMSAQIRQERAAYYGILERTQNETMDVTGWMEWFLGCLDAPSTGAQSILSAVLAKARFWEAVAGVPLNPVSVSCSTVFSMVSRASSRPQICEACQVFPGHSPARHSGTSSNAAFSCGTPKAGAAQAMRWPVLARNQPVFSSANG